MADYNSSFTGVEIDAGITLANSAQQPPAEGAFVNGDKTKLDIAVQSDTTSVSGSDAITNVISLSQAEYDNIATPDAATLYVIV